MMSVTKSTAFISQEKVPSKLSIGKNLSAAENKSDEFVYEDTESDLFLGVVRKRYVKTFVGAIHGITSLIALTLGNWLFLGSAIGLDVGSSTDSWAVRTFFICNVTSVAVVYFFFWNKVQSWQLSTTTMKEKGYTANQVQNLNRGRGVLAPFLCSLYPLAVTSFPQAWLEDVGICRIFSVCLLVATGRNYYLLKDGRRTLYLVYGFNQVGLALSILSHGSVAELSNNWPRLLGLVEKEVFFVTISVQFGFMWYYFFSRRLVSKEFVQNMCKWYHPAILVLFIIQLQKCSWWSSLPKEMWLHPFIATASVSMMFVGKIKQAGSIAKRARGQNIYYGDESK